MDRVVKQRLLNHRNAAFEFGLNDGVHPEFAQLEKINCSRGTRDHRDGCIEAPRAFDGQMYGVAVRHRKQ